MTSVASDESTLGSDRTRRWQIAWSARRSRGVVFGDGAIALVFAGFACFQIARHALWRDELNAWGIVLASPSLGSLFRHMHYEGHPALWHLMLWIASSFTSAPHTIQLLQTAVACGIVGMVALASPFSRGEKLLLLLSYFLLFEYTVLSRNYGIGVLIGFVYASQRSLRPERRLVLASLLGLMANTNVFALILSGALAVELAWWIVGADPGRWTASLRSLLPPALVYIAFVAISAATLWPAPDISWRTTGQPLAGGLTISHATDVVLDHLSALLPLTQQAFWAPQRMIDADWFAAERLAIGLASPLLVFAVIRSLAGQPHLLLVPALTLVGSVLFGIVFYEGSVRHWGIEFVAYVVAFWIERASPSFLAGKGDAVPDPIPAPGKGRRVALVCSGTLLGVNAIAGIVFTMQHWSVPFSNASATADWVKAHAGPDTVLAGTPDTHVAAVAELLGRPAYFLDCRCSDTYLSFQRRRDDFDPARVPARLTEAMNRAGDKPVLFLFGQSLDDNQRRGLADAGLTLRELAHIDGALTENFEIFAVDRVDGPARPTAAADIGANH